MKKKYLYIGIIIIIAVLVGIFSVVNSLMYNYKVEEITSSERNTVMDIIKDIEDESFKNIAIEYYHTYNMIDEKDIENID